MQYDNHEIYLTPQAITLLKNDGVEVLTLRPHCSDKLQPLDISVHKPLKVCYHRAIVSWMFSHPAEMISIFQIAQFFNEGFIHALTQIQYYL